ncbi:MAG: DNA starvation/stationary phase protection protein Dps [Planctomycetota bacterium]
MATTTNPASAKLRPTHHTLDAAIREKSVDQLQAVLYDILDATAFVKQAHWNVKGSNFIAFHQLLDQVYTMLADHSDTVAEQIVILGGQAIGTTRAVAAASRLDAYPTDVTDLDKHVDLLADRLARFGGSLRDAIEATANAGDADTADLFTQVSRDVDKHVWFIEAHHQH